MRALVLLGRLLILLFGVDEVRLLRLHRAERAVHPTHSEQCAHRDHLADVAQAAPRELQVGAAGTDRAAGTDLAVVVVIDVVGGAGAASAGAAAGAVAGGRSVALGRGTMQRRRRLAPKPQHHISHFEAKVWMGRELVDGHDLALGGEPGRAIRARLRAAPRHDADTLLMVDALDHAHWWHLAASVRGRARV